MAQLIEMIGKQFGSWTVVNKAAKYKGKTMWLVKCVCGNTSSIVGAALRNGSTTSCGCSYKLNIIGKKLNKLTVIEEVKEHKPGKRQRRRFLCRCDCGVEKKFDIDKLLYRNIKSCGCWWAEAMQYRRDNDGFWRLPSKKAIHNSTISEYKINAKRRKLPYSLTNEQASKLLDEKCYYCGCPPSRQLIHKPTQEVIKISGIDRLNNSEGYTIKNSVSCCTNCNYKKSNQSFEDFIDWINKVYTNLSQNGRYPTNRV